MHVCVCTLKATELFSIIIESNEKKTEKKHKRKKLKAKSTLAIQVDQNVTRGWRMVVAPTGPIKLRQQTYTHTHTWVTLLILVCINIATHRRICQSIDRSIDWSVSERTNVKFIRYTLHETCQLNAKTQNNWHKMTRQSSKQSNFNKWNKKQDSTTTAIATKQKQVKCKCKQHERPRASTRQRQREAVREGQWQWWTALCTWRNVVNGPLLTRCFATIIKSAN